MCLEQQIIWYTYKLELGFRPPNRFCLIKLQKQSKTYITVGIVPISNRKVDTPNRHTDRSLSLLLWGCLSRFIGSELVT